LKESQSFHIFFVTAQPEVGLFHSMLEAIMAASNIEWNNPILPGLSLGLREFMMDDISDIAAYYNACSEKEHTRLDHHQLEYDLTWRYLDQFLPSHASILEIGTATGRYTLELARRGYQITAVDLSADLLARCKQNLLDHGLADRVQLIVADARDLQAVSDIQFDAILLMGPLYHLILEEDRKRALQQTFAHLRIGGILFSAAISRFGIIGDLARNVPAWIENQAEVCSLLENGKDSDNFPRSGFRGYFTTISEIAPLHESVGLETITLAGVEPAISADDESYNLLQGRQRQLWLDLLFKISAEPCIIAASRHLLYVGKKKG
jgi:S-adenosylmethionine-dependent methyltransferase